MSRISAKQHRYWPEHLLVLLHCCHQVLISYSHAIECWDNPCKERKIFTSFQCTEKGKNSQTNRCSQCRSISLTYILTLFFITIDTMGPTPRTRAQKWHFGTEQWCFAPFCDWCVAWRLIVIVFENVDILANMFLAQRAQGRTEVTKGNDATLETYERIVHK